jgi:predicted dehydrogenase
MKIGVIGLGFMGSTHLQAISRISNARLVAVMDTNLARLGGDLSDIEGNLGIDGQKMDFTSVNTYSSLAEILSDPQVEAVDICLPTDLHAPVAIEALRAGKHVLVEKPIALTGASADEMVSSAAENRRILMAGQVLRFSPAYQNLRDLVSSAQLGPIRSAFFRRRAAVPAWGPWLSDKDKSGGGIFDLLIHDVDIALLLFGVPDSISATGHENIPNGIDSIVSEFHYPEIGSVTIAGGWHPASEYPFSMEYTVVGDLGVAEYSSAGRPPGVYWKDSRVESVKDDEIDPYQAEIEYFVKCCDEGRQPALCDPSSSALSVKVAQLMVEARAQRGTTLQCKL